MAKVKKSGKEVYVYDPNDKLIGYGGVSRTSPLSNFYETEFTYSDHKFNCSEVAIMWTKAITFGDQTTAGKLLNCKSPSVAKRLGRQVKSFDPKRWVDARNEKVPKILYEKFTQNPKLKEWLLSTETAVLAEIGTEDSKGRLRYRDPIWGIAIGPSHQDIKTPEKWEKHGNNFLGKTLMNVRQTIVNETN